MILSEVSKVLIQEIYQLAVEIGIASDPRGADQVREDLERIKREYEEKPAREKEDFDTERLNNPYSDTRVLYGDGQRSVQRVLAGIDIDGAEMLLADRLTERGNPIDMVISHHPEGKALAALHEVMHLQEDILHRLGVPINVAEGMLSERIREVQRAVMPINHNRAVDMARLLDIPLMCVHTPADNLVTKYLHNLIAERKPRTVGDVVEILKGVPEFKYAVSLQAGPQIICGSKERRAGKVFVDMTGGTSGSENSYEKLAQAGVGTIVGMHMSDKHRKEAEKNHLNVIIAGHIASDSLGMNLFLDRLEAGGVSIIPCGGMYRFSRNE